MILAFFRVKVGLRIQYLVEGKDVRLVVSCQVVHRVQQQN
jgi:hypothetical protein